MKKLLAMVLALVMTLSLAVSANAFTDDKSISDDYAEAVAVLNGMGVFKGYEDGSFKPQGDITRAEVSAIVYRVYTQDVKDAKASMYATYNKFSDMTGAGWAQGYIGYCANAELVKGYPNGTFQPSGKVTGYEVLAMILRAVGYDKNGEFSGADWALHVAQTAQQAGVLENVKGVDLNAPASRELVAELLFRAIAEASTVTYTPAFGYQTDTALKLDQKTLGYKNFKLVGEDDSDEFGRPGTTWTYNVGDKETFVGDKAVASYTTKVDECDIAKDLGITSSKKIEKAYIDGVSQNVTNATVTTDRNGKIDPKNTTSLVGAQGRLTEVYDMGSDGYRFVEINTYLAQVTKVTAASTDRNGHVTKASITLTAWFESGKSAVPGLTFETEGFTKDQYVLITVTNPTSADREVQSVEAATVTAMGKVKNWTPAYGTTAATTTVADTKYNDADKFILGYDAKSTNLNTKSYDTIVDAYGNLIGLVKSDINYLVVEKIEWKHDSSAIGNGKALADVVLATGEKVSNVIVASVNDADTSNTGDSNGAVKTAYVSDSYVNNTAYYNHIYAYSVNADGNYELDLFCQKVDATTGNLVTNDSMHNTAAVKFTTGKTSTIEGKTNSVVANNNTKFLVKNINSDTDTYSYTVYNGINELPSMTVTANGGLCYLSDGTFATLVVINSYTLASSKFVAYAEKQNGYAVGYNPVKYEYTVYPVGSTEAVKIYTKTQQTITDGFYEIVKDSDGYATTPLTKVVDAVADATTATTTYDDLCWENGFTKDFDGDSLVNLVKENGSAFADYRVNSDTKYFTVTTTIWNNSNGSGTTQYVEITASEAADLAADKQVVVAYDKDGSDKVISYVYIMKTVDNGQAPVSSDGKINYYVTFKNSNGTVVAEDLLVATQVLPEGTYPNVNWTFLSGAMNGAKVPGTFTVVNSFVPAAQYVNYGCADTYDLTVEGGSTYALHYTATLIG